MKLNAHVTIGILVLTTSTANAQHDPQRNATRHVAAGNFKKVEGELKKADEAEPETHFVRMMSSLKQGDVEGAVKHAETSLKAGLPIERLVVGPRELLKPLRATGQFKEWVTDRKPSQLIHGPMIGATTDTTALVWLRTASKSDVRIKAYQGDKTASESEIVKTSSVTDYTAVLKLNGLKPSTEYRYEVVIDGKVVDANNTHFKTFPATGKPAKFSVGFGGGAGYVPKWEYMWETVLKFQPDAFFMLGDNVYIDDPTHSLTQHYCYYRRQSRPTWRSMVATTSMYSIYDDHDFGTNDCVPGSEIETPSWKRDVWNRFKQNWANPAYGGGEKQPGCWYDFMMGDVHFIMLDGRYYRSRKGTPSMLGPVQKQWLFDTLKSSTGRIKVLASCVPWTIGIKPGSKDPWDGFPQEREEIFSFIETAKIDGVFLIAADRHRTDLRVTARENGYDLYEFESSRLTNRHTHGVVKTPGLIWGYNKTCSFGLMTIDTTVGDPTIKCDAITIDGEKVHTHTVRLSDISNK